MAFGVASWRGLRVTFTDGMCARCAVRFRRQWKLPSSTVTVVPIGAPLAFLRVGGTLLVASVLLLAARPLDEAHGPATMTPPPETVLLPAPIEAPPPPPVRSPRAPRRTAPAPPPAVVATVPSPPPAPDPPPVVAATPTEPLVVAAAVEPVVAVEPSAEVVSASARLSGRPARSTFAALPPAGQTQQTP